MKAPACDPGDFCSAQRAELSGFSFLPPYYPSYRALASTLARLSSLNAPAFRWTHLHAGLARRTNIPITLSDPGLREPRFCRTESKSTCPKPRYLVREVHAAHQRLKARLGAQAIQSRIGVRKDHPLVMLFVGAFKPGDGLIVLAEANVRFCEEETRHIPAPGRFFQFFDQHLRLVVSSCYPINSGDRGQRVRIPRLRWVASLPPLPGHNRRRIHLLLSVGLKQAKIVAQALELLQGEVILTR